MVHHGRSASPLLTTGREVISGDGRMNRKLWEQETRRFRTCQLKVTWRQREGVLGSENEPRSRGCWSEPRLLSPKACTCSPFLSVKLPRAMPPSSAIAADLPRTRGSPRVASWAGQLAAVFPGSSGRFSKKLGEAIDRPTHMIIRSHYNYSWKCDTEEINAVT